MSLARRNVLFSTANFSWGGLALFFTIILLLLRLFAPNTFLQIVTPVFNASSSLGQFGNMFLKSFGNAAQLSTENEKLINENVFLASENHALLKKLNSFSQLEIGVSDIVAGVVSRPPLSPYDTLLLSVGSSGGVSIGQEAFAGGGVPIGVVSDVLANFSRITLFSAPGMAVDGWIGQDNIPIKINGAGAGVMNASVPRTSNIIVGDIVFAPGPGMLPIGTVTRVDSDPSSPSAHLRITPMVNLFTVSWVVIRDTGIFLP